MEELLKKRAELLLAKTHVKARLERLGRKKGHDTPSNVSPNFQDEQAILDVRSDGSGGLLVITATRLIQYTAGGTIEVLMEGCYSKRNNCIVSLQGQVLQDTLQFCTVPDGFTDAFNQHKYYLMQDESLQFVNAAASAPAEHHRIEGVARVCHDWLVVDGHGKFYLWDTGKLAPFAYHGKLDDIVYINRAQERIFLIFKQDDAFVLATSAAAELAELRRISAPGAVSSYGTSNDLLWLQSNTTLYMYHLSSFSLKTAIDLSTTLIISKILQLNESDLIVLYDKQVVWINI